MSKHLRDALKKTLDCLKEMDRHLVASRDNRDFDASRVIMDAERAIEEDAKPRPHPFRILKHRDGNRRL